MSTPPLDGLTERDLDLIEVALDSAIRSVDGFRPVRGTRGLSGLEAEYLHALNAVRRLRHAGP